MLSACPDSYENLAKCLVTEEVSPILFTGNIKEEINQLRCEAQNCAVLDCACTSTVCGRQWLNRYLESLSVEDYAKVKQTAGVRVFKFGGGEKLTSVGCFKIPANIADNEVIINTDVVDSDIPVLLSKNAMKKTKIKLDLENDSAEIYGKQIALNHTTSGHYCIPIDKSSIPISNVYAVKLHQLGKEDRHKALLKLHRQFAHPPQKKLIALIKDSGSWHEDFQTDMNEIYQNCELCKVYAKTPPRPVVSLPMASRFNEKVVMDLKSWRTRWILHLVDMWSRLTVSTFIDRKKTKYHH